MNLERHSLHKQLTHMITVLKTLAISTYI